VAIRGVIAFPVRQDFNKWRRTGMLSRLRTATLAAVVVALGALTSGTAARANLVFDFSGVCSAGCSGTATGVLTLASDYMFGDAITPATFVSFSYASSDLGFTIPATPTPLFVGGLNADGSLNNLVSGLIIMAPLGNIDITPGIFHATTLGFMDSGSQPQFSLVAVPEPGTWALMASGFAALGFVGYRRASARPVAVA
jgi:hypothetical protein